MIELDTAVYGALTAYSGLTALVSTRVYQTEAPQGATLPFVVFNHQAGGLQNTEPTDRIDHLVYARAFATTQMGAALVDAQIKAALHKTVLTISGWQGFETKRENEIALVERDSAGAQVWQRGAMYRIRAVDV